MIILDGAAAVAAFANVHAYDDHDDDDDNDDDNDATNSIKLHFFLVSYNYNVLFLLRFSFCVF